jgi:ribosomal protein S18 acetylase RimI-like enzyme
MPLPKCTRIDFDDDFEASRLTADGWREIEILETWSGPVPKGIGLAAYTPTLADIPALQAVALAAFTEDRLHKDPLVARGEADAAKSKWVADAVMDYKRAVFVSGHPAAGFISVFPGKTMVIDLLAVHPDHQGEGLGKDLVITACQYADAEFVEAGTQSTNEPARKLYKSLGMGIVKRQRTFHK